MNCPRCGAVLPPGTPACTYCGTPVQVPYPPPQAAPPYGAPPPYAAPGYPPPYGAPTPFAPSPYPAAPKTSALAVVGFIFAFLCNFVGLVLSIIALVRINKSNGMLRGKSLAIAGIILSAIFMAIGIVYQVSVAR